MPRECVQTHGHLSGITIRCLDPSAPRNKTALAAMPQW